MCRFSIWKRGQGSEFSGHYDSGHINNTQHAISEAIETALTVRKGRYKWVYTVPDGDHCGDVFPGVRHILKLEGGLESPDKYNPSKSPYIQSLPFVPRHSALFQSLLFNNIATKNMKLPQTRFLNLDQQNYKPVNVYDLHHNSRMCANRQLASDSLSELPV